MEVELCQQNKIKLLLWQVSFSQQDIIETTLDIINMRIERSTIALQVCKHSKRRVQTKKLYAAFVGFRVEQVGRMNTIHKDLVQENKK